MTHRPSGSLLKQPLEVVHTKELCPLSLVLIPPPFQTHLRCYPRCTIALLLEAARVSSYIFRCGRSSSLWCPLGFWLPSLSFAGPTPALSCQERSPGEHHLPTITSAGLVPLGSEQSSSPVGKRRMRDAYSRQGRASYPCVLQDGRNRTAVLLFPPENLT